MLLCIFAFCAPNCFGADRILQEWDFRNATDTLGWRAAEQLSAYGIEDGALTGTAGPGRPKLESPLFDIPVLPWQYVELELKTDGDSSGLIYYSNTTEPPYGGFRQEKCVSFPVVGDNQFHTVTVFPFWTQMSRLIHIRVDVPGNHFAIRAIRILSAGTQDTINRTSWDFADTDSGWRILGRANETKSSSRGWQIVGNRDCTVFCPVSFDSDSKTVATIRISAKTRQIVLLRWVSDSLEGMQAAPIELTPDDRVHSYVLDMTGSGKWVGKILAIGITPSQSAEAGSVTIKSVTIADTPVGPPELKITRFGFDEPVVRVGQKGKLVVEAKNIGGAQAESVAAVVTLPSNKGSKTLPAKRIPSLAPGKSARFEWEIDVRTEGRQLAVCRVNGQGVDAGEKSTELQFYSKLDPSKIRDLKYVPEPVAAKTDYLVGAYYFPGWYTYDRWAVLDDYPERRPVLGYYREGDPEVADWQINWAMSHGISYFIYDWYWTQGTRSLEQGLDALFKSKYGDKFKFCLLWANHNPSGTSSEADLLNVTRFWIDNYFRRPNYLKINGKNVMVIFSPGRFTEDMGSEAVKAAFSKMRKMCEDSGVGGLYLVACVWPNSDIVKLAEAEGYDAVSGYNYPGGGNRGQRIAPYEWMISAYKNGWKTIQDSTKCPCIPYCEPGWDPRPWHGLDADVRNGKSPYLWRQMLENAKSFVDRPDYRGPENRKLVFLEAWNEFGEGDFIEPQAQFGFDYLESVRQVFAPESKKPTIIVPKDIARGPFDLPKPELRTAWNFADSACRVWSGGNINLNYADGVMKGESTNNDPAFYSPGIKVEASQFKKLEIKMKSNVDSSAQIFFAGRKSQFSEGKSVTFPVQGSNSWHIYEVDLSTNSQWKGEITKLRIDPSCAPTSTVEVEYIKFR